VGHDFNRNFEKQGGSPPANMPLTDPSPPSS